MTITYSQLHKAYEHGEWAAEAFLNRGKHPWKPDTRIVDWYRNPRLRAAFLRGYKYVIVGNPRTWGGIGHLSDLLPPKQPNLELGGRIRCRCPGKCLCR